MVSALIISYFEVVTYKTLLYPRRESKTRWFSVYLSHAHFPLELALFIYQMHARVSRPYRQIDKLNLSYKISENTVYGAFTIHSHNSHARLKWERKKKSSGRHPFQYDTIPVSQQHKHTSRMFFWLLMCFVSYTRKHTYCLRKSFSISITVYVIHCLYYFVFAFESFQKRTKKQKLIFFV